MERRKSILVFAAAGILLLLSSCSSAHDPRTVDLERAHDLLDQRQYGSAVPFLEDMLNRYPGDAETAELLAEAHLGRAGIELLPIITRAMGEQDEVPLNLYNEPICPKGAVPDLLELEYVCLAYRFLKQAPVPDNPDVIAARDLFRKYFPVAAETGTSTNFVAAFAEAASALSRIKVLLQKDFVAQMDRGIKYDPKQFPYDPAIHHSKNLITEINWGLERFRGSYDQFSRLVHSLNGQPLLRIGSYTLIFDQAIRTSDILRFASAVAREKTLPLDQYLSEVATEKMHEMSAGLFEMIAAADPGSVVVNGPGGVSITMHFGNYVADVLGGMAEALDKNVEVTLFDLAWKNPPPIVRRFLAAAEKSWDVESGKPLLDYYDETGAAWMELKAIVNDWNAWLNTDMSPEAKTATLSAITADAAPNQAKLATPTSFSPPEFAQWIGNVVGFIGYEVGGGAWVPSGVAGAGDLPVIPFIPPPAPGSTPGAPPPAPIATILMPAQITQAMVLLDRTNAWMTVNFYPMSMWVRTY